MDIDEYLPLEIDNDKAQLILSKVKKTLRTFSLSSGRNFSVPSKETLRSQKYHKNYLELREEGLALNRLVEEAEDPNKLQEATTVFPRFINTRYIDARFNIFTRHPPCISNSTEIEFDPCLKTGQIVVYRTESNYYSVGMIAPKIDDEIYRVFNLAEEYEYSLVKINNIFPFPAIFPKKLSNNSSVFQPGTQIFILQNDQNLERNKSIVLKGKIIQFDDTSAPQNIKYVVELEDNQRIVVDGQFITLQESPFHIEDEEAVNAKIQDLINQGIDQLILLDPKEAKKYKISVAKKNKQKRKQEGLDDEGESTQEVDEEGRVISKKKQKNEIGPVRHSPRTRNPIKLTMNLSDSNTEQHTSADEENENENENENEQQNQEENKDEETNESDATLNQTPVMPTFSNTIYPQPQFQSNPIYSYQQQYKYPNFSSFTPVNLQNSQLGPLTANQIQHYPFSQHSSQQQLYQQTSQLSPHVSQAQLNEQQVQMPIAFIKQPVQSLQQPIQLPFLSKTQMSMPQLTATLDQNSITLNPAISHPDVQPIHVLLSDSPQNNTVQPNIITVLKGPQNSEVPDIKISSRQFNTEDKQMDGDNSKKMEPQATQEAAPENGDNKEQPPGYLRW